MLKLYTDGASKGNPGPAGIGFVIKDSNGDLISEHYEGIGNATNNVAEYTAILKGVEHAKKYKPKMIEIYTDSELVTKQFSGEYRIKDENLKNIKMSIDIALKGICFSVTHIRREHNSQADKLAKKGSLMSAYGKSI